VADIPRLATLGGAEVLDMDDQIGSLTPGKKGDLIALNPRTLNFAPRFNWVSQIVFNGQPVNVEWGNKGTSYNPSVKQATNVRRDSP